MTKLLDKAIETVRKLPASQQDEIAQALLDATEDWDGEDEEVDPDDLPSLLEALAEADAGKFATDEDMQALYRRYVK